MTTVLIVCRECKGEELPDGRICGWCMGQKHEAVDRAFDGGLPVGTKEWIPRTLPNLPLAHPRMNATPPRSS